jgi:hypothetical protein
MDAVARSLLPQRLGKPWPQRVNRISATEAIEFIVELTPSALASRGPPVLLDVLSGLRQPPYPAYLTAGTLVSGASMRADR